MASTRSRRPTTMMMGPEDDKQERSLTEYRRLEARTADREEQWRSNKARPAGVSVNVANRVQKAKEPTRSTRSVGEGAKTTARPKFDGVEVVTRPHL